MVTSNPSLFNTSSRPRRMCGSSSTTRIFAFMSGGLERQAKHETTAPARSRFISDISAMRACDLAGQGKSKAGPLDAAAQSVMGAVKLLENFTAAAIRHPQTTIQNFYLRVRQRNGLRFDADRNLLVGIGIFLRV